MIFALFHTNLKLKQYNQEYPLYYEASLISTSTKFLKYQIANTFLKTRDTILGVKKHSTTATHNRIQPYDSLYLVFSNMTKKFDYWVSCCIYYLCTRQTLCFYIVQYSLECHGNVYHLIKHTPPKTDSQIFVPPTVSYLKQPKH